MALIVNSLNGMESDRTHKMDDSTDELRILLTLITNEAGRYQ